MIAQRLSQDLHRLVDGPRGNVPAQDWNPGRDLDPFGLNRNRGGCYDQGRGPGAYVSEV
jgi:hypothetical protein